MLGKSAVIIKKTDRRVSVRGFADEIGKTISVPVVDGVLAYDCEFTGETVLMIIRNALHVPSMNNHLIPPFMMRLAGLDVNECAKFLAKKPNISHHSVYFPEKERRIPLSITGITSYIPSRSPTGQELDELEILELTPQVDQWDPHSHTYRNQEDSMLDYKGEIKQQRNNDSNFIVSSFETAFDEPRHIVSSVIDRTLDTVLLADDLLARRYASNVIEGTFGSTNHKISSVRHSKDHFVCSVRSKGAKSDLDSSRLADVFNISKGLAIQTMNTVTRLCPRNTADITLNKRYATNDRMLRYSRMLKDLFMDTMFAAKPRRAKNGKIIVGTDGKSARGYTCAQVFATEFGWAKPILMSKKSDAHQAVKRIFKEYGVPPALICDAAREQIFGEVRVICQQAGAELIYLEKGTHNANRAEREIATLKQGTRRDLHDNGSPAVFWCYALERRAAINNAIPRDNINCQNQTPETVMTGKPTDISNISEFKFYEWVKYKREGVQFPFTSNQIGRCLGPAIGQGSRMCQHVLTDKGNVMPIQTLRRLTPSEINSPSELEERKCFDKFIKKRFGNTLRSGLNEETDEIPKEYDWESFCEEPSTIPDVDDFADYEAYMHAEVLLPQNGEHMRAARVVGLVKNRDGREKGNYNPNPVLDTRVYEVMFPDGATEQYAANIIAENLIGQLDDDGRMQRLLESIEDHRVDGTQATIQGSKTTRGHELKCAWKDGTSTWIPLKDLKESYPIETAEFAVAMDLVESPAFKWWVSYTLKKRDQIIAKVQHRLIKKNYKYGHQVPNSVKEAYEFDKEHGNTRWKDAIAKEMKNVRIAFKILEPEENMPPFHEFVPCHMIFDVKMDGTAKARLVAAGCKTADPAGSTWAGVVSRETVRIALTYAALNGLKVMSADIQNAYLTAPTSQKLWTTCGREFGSDFKKRAVITRALYGNKAAGSDFRNHLRDCMELLGYQSCLADPDLWMRRAVKDNGDDYWEYMLLYVDDALCISEYPKEALMEIDKYFMMKPDSINVPKIYLGAKITLEELPNGVKAWSISSSKYIQDSVKNLERKMEEKGLKLRPGVKAPLSNNYRPELDASPELNVEDATFYQSLIGSLRWMVEMGRLDICCEVSMMSSCVSMPREGHLQQVFQIFGYLKSHHNARIILDPSYPMVIESDFPKQDWGKFYKVDKEAVANNVPISLGMEMVIRGYVDADHAGDKVTRRSRTGFIIFVNSAPIYWLSKKQAGVETSTFGSEFLAMKHCCEYLKGLRYKIRMMGIPLKHCCYIYGDNKSVLYNTTLPDSTLKKKHHSVAYHYVREGCATDEWRTTYVKSTCNCSDICTKSLPAGINRKRKIRSIMYDIYPLTEKEEEMEQ